MAVGEAYLTYVLDQLGELRGLTWRRMFGGVGLYAGGAIFAVMDDDQIFLRVDDTTRPRFVAAGAKPWQPMPGREQPSQGYYELPADLLDDRETVVEWARDAAEVAGRAVARKKSSRKKRSKATGSKKGKLKKRGSP